MKKIVFSFIIMIGISTFANAACKYILVCPSGKPCEYVLVCD